MTTNIERASQSEQKLFQSTTLIGAAYGLVGTALLVTTVAATALILARYTGLHVSKNGVQTLFGVGIGLSLGGAVVGGVLGYAFGQVILVIQR